MAFVSEPVRAAPAAVGRSLRAFGRAVLRGIVAARLRQLARTLRHRREAQMLAGLDEHMLSDIGLSRSDLRDAFSGPIWRDPTSFLVRRAGEKRGARRGRPGLPSALPPLPLDRPGRLLF